MSDSSDAGTAAGRPRNRAGRTSLGLGIVVVAVNVGQQVVVQLAPFIQSNADLSAAQLGLVFAPFGVVAGVFALAALITGIVGLTRAGLPKGAAAAGTAIGASTLLALTVNIVAGALYRLAV